MLIIAPASPASLGEGAGEATPGTIPGTTPEAPGGRQETPPEPAPKHGREDGYPDGQKDRYEDRYEGGHQSRQKNLPKDRSAAETPGPGRALQAALAAEPGLAVHLLSACPADSPGLRRGPGAVFAAAPGHPAETFMAVEAFDPVLQLNRSWYLAERVAEFLAAGRFDLICLIHGPLVGLDLLSLARRARPQAQRLLIFAPAPGAGECAALPARAGAGSAQTGAGRPQSGAGRPQSGAQTGPQTGAQTGPQTGPGVAGPPPASGDMLDMAGLVLAGMAQDAHSTLCLPGAIPPPIPGRAPEMCRRLADPRDCLALLPGRAARV